MKSKMMIHKLSGNNFHGNWSLTLRGSAEGFRLSRFQEEKYRHELCGISDCQCHDGIGDGPDEEGAIISSYGEGAMRLIPAAKKEVGNE